MRLSWLARLFTLVFAVVQLAAPSLASAADARIEAAGERSPRAAAHIESHGSSDCPRVHPADCALCHLVHAPAAPAARAGELQFGDSFVAARIEAPFGLHGRDRDPLTLPRAPPAS